MAKAVSFTTGIDGFELWIEYNAGNLRIQSVNWTVPDGVQVNAKVWDGGLLVIDRTEGPGNDSENVPGNYQMVEVTENGDTFLDLPSNITFRFGMNVDSGA